MGTTRKGQKTKLKLLGILKELNIHSKTLVPTSNYLASRLRITTKQIQRHLKALVQEKEITLQTSSLKFDASKNKLYKKRIITLVDKTAKLPDHLLSEIRPTPRVIPPNWKDKARESERLALENRSVYAQAIAEKNEAAFKEILAKEAVAAEKQRAIVEASKEYKPYTPPAKFIMPKPVWVEHKFDNDSTP